jgi:transcriptional regulator with XRE-family HTH domain
LPGRQQREAWKGLGDFLTRALSERGWTQEELGVRSGQSRATINRAMTTDEATRGTAAQIADALGMTLPELRAAIDKSQRSGAGGAPVIRKTPHAGAPAQPTAPVWTSEARAFILEFQAEAARDGAGDEELDYIRRVLTDPGAYVLYEGGRPRQLTADEVMTELQALAAGLRVWLDLRKQRRGPRNA